MFTGLQFLKEEATSGLSLWSGGLTGAGRDSGLDVSSGRCAGQRQRDWPAASRDHRGWVALRPSSLRTWVGTETPAEAVPAELHPPDSKLLGRQASCVARETSRLREAIRSIPLPSFPLHPRPGHDQLVCDVSTMLALQRQWQWHWSGHQLLMQMKGLHSKYGRWK